MEIGAHFEIRHDMSIFRPPFGNVTLQQAAQIIGSAIAFARDRKIRNVMVVATGLTGFAPPTLFDRVSFVEEWVRASRGLVRVALVVPPELIDRKKFGVMAAANRGL